MLTQLNCLLVLLALGGLLTRQAMAKAGESQTLVVQIAEPLPAGLHTLMVDGDTLMVQVLAESLPEDAPPLAASDKRLVGPAQAVSVDSSASVQAEPGAARSDSLSEQMEAMVDAKAAKRENADLRIAKKVVAGTALGVVFGVLGAKAAYEDGLIGYPVFGMIIGSTVGFPLGVTLVDPYDSFVETILMGGIVMGGIIPIVGPIIGSLYVSEKSRKPPQDCRVSFTLAPTLNGGLSASTTLHF